MRARAERLEHRTGHLELLGARLVALVHAPGDAVCRELAEHRLRRRGTCTRPRRRREAPRPCRRPRACGATSFRSKTAPGGSAAATCASTARIGQARGRRELGQAVQQPRRQVREADQRDAPDRRERLDVGQRAVRRAARGRRRTPAARSASRCERSRGRRDAHDLRASRATSREARGVPRRAR